MATALFLGLMSGTSVDGIDAALVALSDDSLPRLLAARCMPMPVDLRTRVLLLSQPGDNEIDRLGELDVDIGKQFAQTALHILRDAGVAAHQVTAIGSHGQTVRHRPGATTPFTMQIGDPNTIAAITGITTVADFRRRDMAAGGQGAPLVPAFHDAVFRSQYDDRLIINIGGMANITLLPAARDRPVQGFDTGPGNVLLDAWNERHHGSPLDRDGTWARTGTVDQQLLQQLLADPYFCEPPPKSTGRERFSLAWLDEKLAMCSRAVASENVQATLVELTTRTIADAASRWGPSSGCVYLCGGGAHNVYLCERLAVAMPGHQIASTAELGVDPDWVEAMAFAWLAQRTLAGLAGNLPAITGARQAVVLGGIYPGAAPN